MWMTLAFFNLGVDSLTSLQCLQTGPHCQRWTMICYKPVTSHPYRISGTTPIYIDGCQLLVQELEIQALKLKNIMKPSAIASRETHVDTNLMKLCQSCVHPPQGILLNHKVSLIFCPTRSVHVCFVTSRVFYLIKFFCHMLSCFLKIVPADILKTLL